MNATSPIGRAAPAELTGRHAPEWVGEQTRRTWCWRCGVDPGTDCTCGPAGYHLARFIRARDEGRISSGDVLYAMPPDAFNGEQLLTGGTVVPNPGAAA